MKKIFFSLLLSVMFLAIDLSAQDVGLPENAVVMVTEPVAQRLPDGEGEWLPGLVRDKVQADFQAVTKFSFVSFDINVIKKMHEKTSDSAYDEKDALALGKMTTAKYAVFMMLRYVGSGYVLTGNFVDLTSGKMHASVASSLKKTTEDVFSVPGCACDEITLKLCGQLNVVLRESQKAALLKGDVGLESVEASSDSSAIKKKTAEKRKDDSDEFVPVMNSELNVPNSPVDTVTVYVKKGFGYENVEFEYRAVGEKKWIKLKPKKVYTVDGYDYCVQMKVEGKTIEGRVHSMDTNNGGQLQYFPRKDDVKIVPVLMEGGHSYGFDINRWKVFQFN